MAGAKQAKGRSRRVRTYVRTYVCVHVYGRRVPISNWSKLSREIGVTQSTGTIVRARNKLDKFENSIVKANTESVFDPKQIFVHSVT